MNEIDAVADALQGLCGVSKSRVALYRSFQQPERTQALHTSTANLAIQA